MGKDSKPRLHVEIGIDGVSNSVVDLHGSYMDLLIAATYIINVFYRTMCKHGNGEKFKRDICRYLNDGDSVVWRSGGPEHGKG
nr:MAG TPA: hypothetical protein [Caudoviricetes sp.]